jgi:DNA-binding NarL/FixJ family response regulator
MRLASFQRMSLENLDGARETKAEKGAPGSGARIRLWIIEDNFELRDIFQEFFQEEQGICCVRVFGSAEEAVVALESEAAPDVLLSDLNLPGLSGLQALPIIKHRAPEVRVVIMTTFYDDVTRREAQRAGAMALLTKQAGLDRLAEAVREAYTQARASQAIPARSETAVKENVPGVVNGPFRGCTLSPATLLVRGLLRRSRSC